MIRRQAIAVLALLGFFLAVYLTLHAMGRVGLAACTAGGACEKVQSSQWSKLFGLPVAAWGAAHYLLMVVLAVLGTTDGFASSRPLAKSLVALTLWGVIFSAWLTSLEAFRIHAWCPYCLTSATISVVLCVLAIVDYRQPVTSPA